MAFSIPWAPWNQAVTAEPKMACKSGPGMRLFHLPSPNF